MANFFPVPSTLTKAYARLDAFVNTLTSLGDVTLDKGSSWAIDTGRLLSLTEQRLAYRDSYYARRVVDLVADDATAEGWEIINPKDPRAAQDYRWVTLTDIFGLNEVMRQALVYARAFGTGYIVPITFDTQDLDRPLDINGLFEVQDVLVFDPEECQPQRFYSEQTAFGGIGRPSAYRIYVSSGNQFVGRWGEALNGLCDIHPSRVIPVVGIPVSHRDRLSLSHGEGLSIFQAMWTALARADAIDGAAALLAQEMKQDVVTVPDLKAIGTSDAEAAFRTRMSLIKLSKSLLNMIVLADGETYESRANTVSGFKELSENARNAMIAATGIPEPILFGKAASGLATAPGTEQDAYLRLLRGEQHRRLKPALRRIYELLARSRAGAFFGKREAASFDIRFLPLSKESQKDKEARRLIQAQRDSIHAGMLAGADPDAGTAFAKFVIEGRYSADGWQDDLPQFVMPPPAPKAPTPPQLKGFTGEEPPPGEEPPQSGQGKDQTPPEGPKAPPKVGGQGVDVQANNTGKGQFDSADEDRASVYDSKDQQTLTEFVLIDSETYAGKIHTLPASAQRSIQQAWVWHQRHSEEMPDLPEAFWRRVSRMMNRREIGDVARLTMSEQGLSAKDYEEAAKRARTHKKPWTELAIVVWMSWGGSDGVRWAGTDRGEGEEPL